MAPVALDYRYFRFPLMYGPIAVSIIAVWIFSLLGSDAHFTAAFIIYFQFALAPAAFVVWLYLRRRNLSPPTYYGPKVLNDSAVFNLIFNLAAFGLCFAAYYFVTFIHVEFLPSQLQGGFYRATRAAFIQSGAYSFSLMQAFEVLSNLSRRREQ